MRYTKMLGSAMIAALMAHVAVADTWYVRIDGCDTHDGDSPSDAFRTVQQALGVAGDGDTIDIGPGTFYADDVPTTACPATPVPSNTPTATFFVDKDLTIVGHFSDPAEGEVVGTILRGSAATAGSYHVVTIVDGADCTFKDLTITLGDARLSSFPNGSLVLADGAGDVAIDNCQLTNGVAFKGGGIYFDGGQLSISESVIHACHADSTTELIPGDNELQGGGVWATGQTLTVDLSTLNECSIAIGTVAGNGRGAGIYSSGALDVNVTDTTFFKCSIGAVEQFEGEMDGGAAWLKVPTARFDATFFMDGVCATSPREPVKSAIDSCGVPLGRGQAVYFEGGTGETSFSFTNYVVQATSTGAIVPPGIWVNAPDGRVTIAFSHSIIRNLTTTPESGTEVLRTGGALSLLGNIEGRVSNSVFYNINGGPGAVIYTRTTGENRVSFEHLTVAECSALDSGGTEGVSVETIDTVDDFNSCILWVPGGIVVHGITYSDIMGGHSGTGNFAIDPQFREPLLGNPDFRLRFNSPCKDTADPSLDRLDFSDANHQGTTASATDLDGGIILPSTSATRIFGTNADVGAYEYATDCAADFNVDCDLNPDDLADYLSAYFAALPGKLPADFNNDGNVDPDDLADYISAYFTGCSE